MIIPGFATEPRSFAVASSTSALTSFTWIPVGTLVSSFTNQQDVSSIKQWLMDSTLEFK